jgi:hypothetical protein
MSAILTSILSFIQGKGLFMGGAILLILTAAQAQTCRLEAARAELQAEKAAHKATRRDLAHTRGLWLIDQRAANGTIKGLQGQLEGALADFAAYRKEEAERSAIAAAAAPRPRTEKEKDQVVDDATRRRVVDFLNAF